MAKKFNITGLCLADKHYMADVSGKLEQVIEMIDNEDYFIINRPRQFGKTTTLYTLTDMLEKTGKYVVFNISFEGIGDVVFETEKAFVSVFVKLLARYIRKRDPKNSALLSKMAESVTTFGELSDCIIDFSDTIDKKAAIR